MRNHLTAAILLGLLASCSSEQGPSDSNMTAAAGNALQDKTALPFAARSAMSSFASLPDRGELLAYEQGRKTKHSGAYTAYPVGISEAHALHAMQTGEMVVKAPNGELLRLKYESHEESPDGNWTWIGRNADGAEAILTFGEKAVFGVIPQGAADTLRLTMSAGQSWLVQTDRSKLAGLDGTKRRAGGDQLVPPKLAGSGSPSLASLRAESVTANAAASSAVVDVLLGYTNGFASQYGGQSQAVTRLNNMVAITNQAYANSGVNMRARLVKAVQVTFPDNTDNGDALEKLTGYKAGDNGGEITPDPAFDALRAARDESGADLVSLVRAFRTPENQGCGIAWLIGGDQTGISEADAPFGYSVVSDGTDIDEDDDNTYFCREETLAHEMGHNMGQAHNSEDSDSSGVHAYSYGYRESSTDGFYTVMAYPVTDGNQAGIRYFANPDIKFSGRATGVANQSDNVRSMNQTMPIIATFRDTKVPGSGAAKNDFNGDQFSDILWRDQSGGANVIWRSGSSANAQAVSAVNNLAWKVVGSGDFDGDGKADILWRNSSTGANQYWKGGDSTKAVVLSLVSNQAWKVAGVGDFDGDGKDDILWRNSATGANAVWKSGSTATEMAVTTVGNLEWQIAGVGDFNGDGKDDILWRNTRYGKNQVWRSGDSSTITALATVGKLSWKIVGAGDFNGDGADDILWRDTASGRNAIWLSGNANSQQKTTGVSKLSWGVAGVGDFNGDGKSDILWRNSADGRNTIWRSGNDATQISVSSRPVPNWVAVGF